MATETFSSGTVRIHKQVLSGTDVQVESADQNNPTTLKVHDSTLGNVAVTITSGAFFPIADMTVKGTVNEVGTLQLGGGFLGVNFRSILDTTIANNSDFNLTGTVQEGGPTSQWTIDGKGTFSNNGTVNISGAETTIGTPVALAVWAWRYHAGRHRLDLVHIRWQDARGVQRQPGGGVAAYNNAGHAGPLGDIG